jgi:hypothetical protein
MPKGNKPHSGNGKALQTRGLHRFIGVDHDGNHVDNVTNDNRYDVITKKPWIPVALMTEDCSVVLHQVFIRNRRERPDVIMYDGLPYLVKNSNLKMPQYTLCMADEAVDEIPRNPEETT